MQYNYINGWVGCNKNFEVIKKLKIYDKQVVIVINMKLNFVKNQVGG